MKGVGKFNSSNNLKFSEHRIFPAYAIRRPRLVKFIDKALHEARVVILEAPAGSGKSVALAEWASTWKGSEHTLWVTMDLSMSHQFGFWSRVIDKFKTMNFVNDSTKLLEIEVTKENIAHVPLLLASALNSIAEDVLLVLDEGEFAEDENIPADLVRLIEHTTSLKILSTANSLRGHTRQLVINTDTVIIGARDLALNESEIEEVLSADLGKESLALVGLIIELGGNISSVVRMITQELKNTEFESWESTVREIVASYFEVNVLDKIDGPELHSFIIGTSLIGESELTAELASELMQIAPEKALDTIEKLNNLGFGTWRPNLYNKPFRYHNVILNQLAAEHVSLQPEETNRIHNILCDWEITKQRPDLAFVHAIKAGNIDKVKEIITRYFLSFNPKIDVNIIRAFDLLPASTVENDVTLLFFRAVIRIRKKETQIASRRDFIAATTIIENLLGEANPIEALLYEVIIQMTYRINGQWGQLGPRLHVLEKMLKELEVLPLQDWEKGLIEKSHQILSVNYLSYRNYQKAIEQAEYSLQWLDESRTPEEVHGSSRSIVAYGALMVGDVAVAKSSFELARQQQIPYGWKEGGYGNNYQIAEIMFALEENNLEIAAKHLHILENRGPILVNWTGFVQAKAIYLMLEKGARYSNGYLVDQVVRFNAANPWSEESKQALLADWCMILASVGMSALGTERIQMLDRKNPWAATALNYLDVSLGKFDIGATGAMQLAVDERVPIRLRVQNSLTAAAAMWAKNEKDLALEIYQASNAASLQHQITLPYRFLPKKMSEELHDYWVKRFDIPYDAEERKIANIWRMGVAQSFLTEIKLTNREKDVLKALMRDLTLQEIAEELFISPNTVKTTRSSLYRKLEASNKAEAITTALSHGII